MRQGFGQRDARRAAIDGGVQNGPLAFAQAVTGFFGEICLRAYYSRVYLETDLAKSDDPDEFMDLLMAENRSALTDTEVRKKFREIYGATLQSLPGDSMIEKYDLHYLFFRNGLHCSDVFRMVHETPRIGIIQSKALFALKRRTYGQGPVTRLQNDVIARLAPQLLAVPYASQRDNEDLAAARASMVNRFPEDAAVPVAADGSAAVSARAAKR